MQTSGSAEEDVESPSTISSWIQYDSALNGSSNSVPRGERGSDSPEENLSPVSSIGPIERGCTDVFDGSPLREQQETTQEAAGRLTSTTQAEEADQPDPGTLNEVTDNESDPDSVVGSGNSRDETAAAETGPLQYWDPAWLAASSLYGFAAVMTAFALVLILLWVFSNRSHGFALLTKNHYAWTYGPTAVLVIVIGIWRQIDFWCKSLEPWRQLKKGSTSAEASVLLDYVSPILPTSLIRALRLKHWTIVATTTGFILLKLITVASTGLLVPVTTQMPSQNVPLVALSTFNATGYDVESVDSTKESLFDYQAYALIAEGLPYPEGTNENVGYQRFASPSNPTLNQTSALLKAEVNAFYPWFECEVATIIPLEADVGVTQVVNASVSWDSCKSSKVRPLNTSFHVILRGQVSFPSRKLYGGLTGQPGDSSLVCPDDPDTVWQLFTMMDVRYNQSSVPGATFQSQGRGESSVWEIQVMPVTGIVCNLSYSIEKAQVTYNYAQNPPTIEVDGPLTRSNAMIPGFNLSAFSYRYFFDCESATNMVGNYITDALELEYPDPFFAMMKRASSASYEDFLGNGTTMAGAAKQVYSTIAVQIANYWVVRNGTFPLQGHISQPETRLQISHLALWLMVAGFLLMLIVSVVVAVTRPVHVVTCNIETISSIALILTHSAQFQTLLTGSGQLRLSAIRNRLSGHTYRSEGLDTARMGPLAINVIAGEQGTRKNTNKETKKEKQEEKRSKRALKSPTKWWIPLLIRWPLFVSISALPLALIATLEVLQHLSDRDVGIVSTSSSGDLLTVFGTRFIPALVILLVATTYSSVDFNVALFSPFHKLKKGNAAPRSSIMSSLLGKTPLHALYIASIRQHWAAIFSIIAALVASVLTIIVSGLYTVENITGPASINLQRLDQFDPSWPDSIKNDGGAAVLISSFEMLNLSYPSFTYDELAIPTIRVDSKSVKGVNGSHQSPMIVRLPALRASLNCTVASSDQYSVDITGENNSGRVVVNGSAALTPQCSAGIGRKHNSLIQWSNINTLQNIGNPNWVAQIMDLHVGPLSGDNLSSGETNSSEQQDNPLGCPSLAVVFGNFTTFTADDGTLDAIFAAGKSNFTTMSCYQMMTEVQTDVTFAMPNLTITSAIPDESTVTYLESGPNGETAFEYRPQVHFDLELLLHNNTYGAGGASASVITQVPNINNVIDSFFAMIFQGTTPVDPADLWGPHNHDRLINAVQRLYRRYMAQVASAKMRVALNATKTAPQNFVGTWNDPNRGRLRQNNASKIALQTMLGAMFVCGIIAYALIGVQETLPHNPCSIAGTASLLAGSEMCGERMQERMPEGVEWMSNEVLTWRRVWDGWVFSMRLWDGAPGEQGQRRFGIDLRTAEEVKSLGV